MTDKRQWTMLTALLCLAVLVAGWFLLAKPQHSKASKFNAETTQTQEQVQTLQARLAMLVEEQRNMASEQASLARIIQQLPADPQLPTLLRKVDAAAKATGVDLVNVAPTAPVAFTPPALATTPGAAGTATATTATTAANGAVPGLADIPVAMTLSGSYPQVERFVDQLEGLSRSLLVNSFTIAYSNQKPTGAVPVPGSGELTVNLNTEVFMSTAAAGLSSASATTAK